MTGNEVPSSSAESPALQSSVLRRRLTTRFGCDLEAVCTTEEQGEPLVGRVRNISEGGLSLLLPRYPDPARFLTLQIFTKDRTDSRTLQVRVLYALKPAPDGCVIGASFPQKLSVLDLQALLA
jgi:hypothetical protein